MVAAVMMTRAVEDALAMQAAAWVGVTAAGATGVGAPAGATVTGVGGALGARMRRACQPNHQVAHGCPLVS